MTSKTDGGGSLIAGINVTPLVDIMLVLLVIFIVTAKIIVTPAIPLQLPQASRTEELPALFLVVVPAAGPTLVNGEPAASDSAILGRARQAHATQPQVQVIIDADGAVPHRRVIHILDLIKRAGIARVAFGAVATAGDGLE